MSEPSGRPPFLGLGFHLQVPSVGERPPLVRLAMDMRIRRLDVVVHGLIAIAILATIAVMTRWERPAVDAPVQGSLPEEQRPLGVVRR